MELSRHWCWVSDGVTLRIAQHWTAAGLPLLLVAALFYFSFRMDSALDQALPGVALGHRADVETSLLVYLPEVAMEPAFDAMLRFIEYPHPLIGPRRQTWEERLTAQIAQAQRAQGLDPDVLLGGGRPLDSLFALKTNSLDEFGKAIDMALVGGYRGPWDASLCGPGIGRQACVVRQLFARVYGEQAARDAAWPSSYP